MRYPNSGLRIDDPALPLLQAHISYWGLITGAGAADGTTFVCSNLSIEPSYVGHLIKILSGNAAGQTRRIISHVIATGVETVDDPFTDSAGAAVQIIISTLFAILSNFESEVLYYGTTTAVGLADGSTLIDTGLATPFTIDDEPIGHTVRILTSGTASLVGQEREIHDYDVGATVLYFATPFTSQVPVGTTYAILRNRPSGGGEGPQPEPEIEETSWKLADFDNFDVADPTADTERWSSEYISAGAADGTADINTTTANRLYVNITAAALAIAEYGVRRQQLIQGTKWLSKVDCYTVVANPNVNAVWAGLSVSRGAAWDALNYIRIYKRQTSAPLEGIATEYNIAGGGIVTTTILATTQDDIAFKIERIGNIWRFYYSLSLAPRHHWLLAQEIEDATNSMSDQTSVYLSVYNPEDAIGQQITCNFDKWELYYTLANLGDILTLLSQKGGALAYLGYCSPAMVASTTVVVCPNLIGFGNDCFNSGYQMVVLRNANSLLAAPEMEMRDITDYVSATGTFTTEAFSVNVEASDIVLVIHNSVAKNISAFGIADAGSTASQIRDAARTEADDWWNGQQVIMLSGAARGQVRPIWDFVAATDDILVSPDFDGVVAAGEVYAILTQYSDIVPRTADDVTDRLTSQVIGRKSDTAVYAKDTASTIIRYLKGLVDATVTAWGTADAGSGVGLIRDAARAEANDWWNGQTALMLTGLAAGQKRPITDFLAATDDIIIAPNFDAAVAAGDVYVILAHYNMIVPRSADDTANSLTSEVVGRKDDTADYTYNATQSSIIRFLKGLLGSIVIAEGTFTTGSATAPIDNTRGEAADFFNGHLLMPIAGGVAFQPRRIVDFAFGGTFTIDPNNPFTVATGLVAYIIIADQTGFVPAQNSANNITPADVIGNKTDTNVGNSLLARQLVPAADSADVTNMRDVVGNKASSAIYALSNTADAIRYLKGILDLALSLQKQNSLEKFWEPWQDEIAGIDPNWWVTAIGGTGTAARSAAEAGVLKVILNCPAGADTARLLSVQRWRCDPANFRTNSIVRKFIFKFRAKVANLANIDNAVTILGGLTPGVANTRASNDIAAFILSADAITSLTDNGGVETTNNLNAGLVLTDWLLFQIEIYRDGANNTIKFTVTDAAGTSNSAIHITNIPVQNMYLQFYGVSEAAVACALHVGELDASYYDNANI